jgi:hypothetical protein
MHYLVLATDTSIRRNTSPAMMRPPHQTPPPDSPARLRSTGVELPGRYSRRPVTDDPSLPLTTRLWLACLCFFRVLIDGRFAARVSAARVELQPAPSLPPPTSPPPGLSDVASSALQLLALLQREGRLVDFIQQDIAAFPDIDVGAAARVVHEGCRRALRAHAQIEPVLREDEGARVELAAGFDADEVKLVGDVRGQPPYAGVLRHRGWRATKLELPQVVGGHDTHVLAPAEVELG